eukprot:5828272-Pleurochrysis_carterae.AAC.1
MATQTAKWQPRSTTSLGLAALGRLGRRGPERSLSEVATTPPKTERARRAVASRIQELADTGLHGDTRPALHCASGRDLPCRHERRRTLDVLP